MPDASDLRELLAEPVHVTVHGAPGGQAARTVAELARAGRSVVHVALDDAQAAMLRAAIQFFAPDLPVRELPAWDCLPYDRVSPSPDIVSARLDALVDLASETAPPGTGRVLLTTVSSVLQRLPPRADLAGAALRLATGERVGPERLTAFLADNGFTRVGTVGEAGEYAVRGGIVDLFPPGSTDPLRVDFFGDEIETIRQFDPLTQRGGAKRDSLDVKPVSEILLTDGAIERFRGGYRARFGTGEGTDPLYEAVSAGRRYAGMEHWLPLFHERLETVADYLPGAIWTLDHQVEEAVAARHELIRDYYETRVEMNRTAGPGDGAPYRPLPPDLLYLAPEEWTATLESAPVAVLLPYAPPESGAQAVLDAGGRPGRDFADLRAGELGTLYNAAVAHLMELAARGSRPILACRSEGSRDRITAVLGEHGLGGCVSVDWDVAAGAIRAAVLPLDRGFEAPDLAVVTEADILGDRLSRPRPKRRRAEQYLTELSSLEENDFVVHVDHGVGQYAGLETLDVNGAPHDCLCVVYEGGDRLFVPVETMEVLSRYGGETAGANLDRLGGSAWQARKARVRKRLKDMADALIKVAATRHMREGERLPPPHGLYDEFAARFPYPETDDQARAIEDVLEDLSQDKPMDRLVCGDVGFGKTEVALRAAFCAAMNGKQVAVVVPTTLLARQHVQTFRERFQGLPVRIEQLSRFVTTKEANRIKADAAEGQVDILIGTQAILGKAVRFRDLGLVIVDEEQHFGVKQKEALKQLRAEVHVLTLTATPIPRTLQMAMAGVRDMSIIATPPVDRLAVRTFVTPFDPVVIREAVLREHFRGGQVFCVCPRIEDIDAMRTRLEGLVPEIRITVAHGQMAATQLDEVMNAFYDGQYDLLLSTNIVESGLDLPRANTIIIHRADLFGLAQLYQLRGRVGRSKVRAYAYLTLKPGRILTKPAEKRLHVMQTLDTLGAGFSLASHDLDIRGAGNLLGEEQSGQIREVGVELYQHMLEEAVAQARAGEGDAAAAVQEEWVPQINVGSPVLIPEAYVEDLSIRLGLYRRISTLADKQEIEGFAAELIDRFGALPVEVENLLRVVEIKALCRTANVEKVDAGPKGAVVSFRENRFARPEKLVGFIAKQAGTVKVRPDHKLVYRRAWEKPDTRLAGVQSLLSRLAALAA